MSNHYDLIISIAQMEEADQRVQLTYLVDAGATSFCTSCFLE